MSDTDSHALLIVRATALHARLVAFIPALVSFHLPFERGLITGHSFKRFSIRILRNNHEMRYQTSALSLHNNWMRCGRRAPVSSLDFHQTAIRLFTPLSSFVYSIRCQSAIMVDNATKIRDIPSLITIHDKNTLNWAGEHRNTILAFVITGIECYLHKRPFCLLADRPNERA